MSSRSVQEIEKIYMDYLQESKRIFKEYQRAYLPYAVAALVVLLVSGASCLSASSSLGPSGARTAFWLGLIIAGVVFVVGANKAKKHASEEASKTAKSKPGFEEFFRLHLLYHRWPKQMVTGKKYEQFLSIIGRKESA